MFSICLKCMLEVLYLIIFGAIITFASLVNNAKRGHHTLKNHDMAFSGTYLQSLIPSLRAK